MSGYNNSRYLKVLRENNVLRVNTFIKIGKSYRYHKSVAMKSYNMFDGIIKVPI